MDQGLADAMLRVLDVAQRSGSVLDLSGLGLEMLPESLLDLTEVDALYLMDNQLTVLPEWLGKMTWLRFLSLNNNQLVRLPDSLGNLTRLTYLHLGGNALVELPDSLGCLNDVSITLNNNPLVYPPPEILRNGNAAILAFLRDSAESKVRLWASKLLIVGEATVGKTSLAKQLTGGVYDPAEGQTHGVHIDPLTLAHPHLSATTMTLNVWDFGGQLEYRATQRFYLTDRSLFVLVWNRRARWQDGKLKAWLDVIKARAPESPILIVATHDDEASAALPPENLRADYPRIVGIHAVDAKSARGVDEVLEAIRRESASLPLMGVSWPKTWVDAADAVRGLSGHAATARQMWQVMTDAGVTDPESQLTIAKVLHDLGDIVFFADDRELNQKVILRPEWLDARITAVLDSEPVAVARGVMTRAERERLWGDLEDLDLLDRLLRMMERFDLAYRIGDADQSEDVALVVERLGDACPPEADEIWERACREPGVKQVGIVYKLKSRQAGIPTWFIAREHQYTTGLHWSHGALLHDRDPEYPAYALLVDDGRDQPTITLSVCGRFPVRFLSVLAEAFENIVDRRYTGLIEQKLVPCACQAESSPQCGHAFLLEELILEANDTDPGADRKVRCPKSRLKIEARVMLDGLRGSGISEQLDDIEHTLADHGTTLNEISERQLATVNGIRSLLAHRTQAGVHCPSLFAVEDMGRSRLLRRDTLRLSLWCEWPYGPSGPHALEDGAGVYTLTSLPLWLRTYLPYLRLLVTTLGLAAPMIAPALIASGVDLGDRAKSGFEFMDKLLEAASRLGESDESVGSWVSHPRRPEVGADFRALRNALRELDPKEVWGGLSPIARPEDRSIVYLCREHVRALEYPYNSLSDVTP